MKRSLIGIILIATLASATVGSYVASRSLRPKNDEAGDGAFRDGMYLGTLDARHRELPHFAVARWSTERDRQSFVRGYKQGYRETLAAFDRSKESQSPYFSGVTRNRSETPSGR